jgi:dihydroneopterin aldolase
MINTIIKDYEFETIIGLLDFERTTPQRVRINIEFQSNGFIDYIDMINFIETIFDTEKFGSVESAVEITSQRLKENFSNLIFLKMEILKIEIVKNALVGARIDIKY